MHLVSGVFCCLIIYLSWDHKKGVITNQHAHLNLCVRIISFWTKQLWTLSKVCIPSSLTPLICQIWIHHLRSLMSLLPQSLQGSYVWLVLFLILLNHSLLLASNLIRFGARHEHCFCLCHWQTRC